MFKQNIKNLKLKQFSGRCFVCVFRNNNFCTATKKFKQTFKNSLFLLIPFRNSYTIEFK